MYNFYQLFKPIRLLSLDIVAGALAISYYFSIIFDVSLPGSYWLALGLGTWLIYLVNNFANSWLPGTYTNKAELKVLRSHRKFLGRLSFFCLISLIILMFFLPVPIILFGLLGILIIAIYFVVNQIQHYSQRATLPRELIIACTYTAGTAGIPMLYSYYTEPLHWLMLAAVLFLALCNTLIFAILDYNHNSKTGIKSMAVRTSIRKTRTMALITAFLSGVLFISSFLMDVSPILGIIGLSMVSTYVFILIILPKKHSKYLTLLSDLVLLFPIILFFV